MFKQTHVYFDIIDVSKRSDSLLSAFKFQSAVILFSGRYIAL